MVISRCHAPELACTMHCLVGGGAALLRSYKLQLFSFPACWNSAAALFFLCRWVLHTIHPPVCFFPAGSRTTLPGTAVPPNLESLVRFEPTCTVSIRTTVPGELARIKQRCEPSAPVDVSQQGQATSKKYSQTSRKPLNMVVCLKGEEELP